MSQPVLQRANQLRAVVADDRDALGEVGAPGGGGGADIDGRCAVSVQELEVALGQRPQCRPR
jgi:hypothetical protein